MKRTNRNHPDGEPVESDRFDPLTGKSLVGADTNALLNTFAPVEGPTDKSEADDVVDRLINFRPSAELRDLLVMAVHEGVEDMIEITDEKHRVLYVNRAFERRTGHRLEDIRGRSIGEVMHSHAAGQEYLGAIEESLLARRSWSGLLVSRRKDGGLIYCDAIVVPLDIDGQSRRHMTIRRDLTTRRNVVRKLTETRERLTVLEEGAALLKQANEELRRVERLKDEFVSVVSHELRTPITAISAALGLLNAVAGSEFAPAQERLLRMAKRNTERMTTIVNDMLTVGKLESGHMSLDIRIVSPVLTLAATVEAVESVAEREGVSLALECAPCDRIPCDRLRIEQAITNLLANAIRFTPRGGTVTAKVAPTDDGVRFSVIDEGPGILESQFEVIFERFRQAEGVNTREHGGTGLGLAIVKSIAEMHQGRVGVESTVGVGSHFWIDLPAPNLADEFSAS